ncbi:bifunctional enzyme CysN/CysC [Halanaerobium congolense]|uniref:sulfate adenylyltransferase n=1 Tax=Halanaerobium congolense TaxID=54121 RepID=A0A1H9ZUF5_9FIRM|nr:GTP-binding protein [Halanaerobium congolense]PTX16425.1 bifunctional enzyme CysN/CysC [Halanaerobium congolense]SDF18948.1 bifunctional enzyme CysN/CysC [Halanaerobium congolense]SES85420.1 bifunctional enzyme CysN/CysC [Halanaerobium congolense]SFO94265.1 bifunctional enzyme CysN/CysC [Halanaerobium congolense]
MNNTKGEQDLNLVIAGHVDHGKSTIIGRMLADTDSLPEGKLEQVKETCRKNSKPFEYAFLLDALKDEQAQGITIDSARVFFQTDMRQYIILDAPGHIEFLKNMVTGAARAEAALLVIDASEGVRENSRRHGYMLSMLGIKQIAVVVNKMDLVDYDQDTYKQIVAEYTDFLAEIGLEAETFIPVSGMLGDNVAAQSDKMDWYHGQTVLEQLDSFENEALPHNKPFRMPVQDVYKFTKGGDDRRIVAGTVEAGEMNVGDEVVFYPSGKKSTVKSIEGFKEDKQHKVKVGKATGFTLDEQIYITRGELAARADEAEPRVSARIKANLFWLARQDLVKDKVYYLKVGTAKVKARLQKINRVIDASNLNQDENKEKIERHDVAEVVFKLDRAMAFDLAGEIEETSRFVIVDEFEIAGGGIISEALEDEQSWVREKVMRRNYKWEQSLISREERAEKYNQKSTLILITGEEDVGKKPTAKALEKRLFNDGKVVYFLGIGNLLYGVDADIKNGDNNNQEEHLRRLAEVSHLMLDAGAILIVTAVELTQANLELIKTTVNPQQIETVWLGDRITTDLEFDLHIPEFTSEDQVSAQIKGLLQDRGIIFRPW